MNVSYQSFASSDSCVICLETMENTDSVAHTGHGHLHPLHRECIKNWLTDPIHNTCPFCQAPVDKSSLFPQKSWGDRLITEIKLMARDGLDGVECAGASIGVVLIFTTGAEIARVAGAGYAAVAVARLAVSVAAVAGTVEVAGRVAGVAGTGAAAAAVVVAALAGPNFVATLAAVAAVAVVKGFFRRG